MGGIAGIYRERGPIVRGELERMLEGLECGAGDERLVLSSSIGFCSKRDVIGREGKNPFQRGDITLAFTGRIINGKELAEELRGKGSSLPRQEDPEVILNLYRERGQDFLTHLRGGFALALWDRREKRLILARDRFGIKPLYYYHDHGTLLFASTIKALLRCREVSLKLNPEALWHYLTLQYVPHPLTLFLGVEKISPGEALLVREGEEERWPYWKVKFPDEYRKEPPSYYMQGSKELLEESVQLHLTNQPTGAFLSGGVDSALLTALLARQIKDLKAFTVSFPHQDYNESLPASRIAKELGILHYQVMVTPEEFMERLPHLVWHMDEPIADPSAISLYFVAALARDHVQVIFSGEGADEIFGGYPIYGETKALAPLRLLPPSLLKRMRGLSRRLPSIKGSHYLYRATTPLEERYLGNAFIFSEEEKGRLLKKEFERKSTASFFSPYYEEVRGKHPLTKMQYLDLTTWMPGDILMKAETMTRACSLELRAPFLDDQLFTFAASIPPKYRLLGGESKHILRQVARAFLPNEICSRRKLGFPTPIRVWLRKEMLSLARELLFSSTASRFFVEESLASLLERHLLGAEDYSRELWTIMIFILWYDTFLR